MIRYFLAIALSVLLISQAVAAEKYIVASDCTWPPMELLDDQKQPDGYSVEYLKEMTKKGDLDLEFQNIAWDGIFGGVATGKYDNCRQFDHHYAGKTTAV